MIDRILPAAVKVVSSRTDPPEAVLFAEEAALVTTAVPKRRQEFTTVRHCARLALASLDVPPAPILPGVRGAPVWPSGIVGSMTHCAGYRAAAVARTTACSGVGIDAEVDGPLPEGVLDLVSSEEERAHLASLAESDPGVQWERLLFSAKESVYKVWSPRTGRWLGFEEAALTFDPAASTFTARILVDGPFETLTGRFLIEDGIVLTAIACAA
ncbi:4'-phosphopantetheinyl transferase family protein [Actinoplanes friuliensis]|jgi:4'-phosphopantetheinyl transferase EntD|uniref:4'-phosphopantetheinyl transferase family protein n=1 Tax=Actinoplanes friuliensis TaxID=196914 RepID=UPI00059FD918|nr:4'-phosphopantetheinyl transferase superfamily protein [Actinoplanes friuliensis]